MIKTFNPAIYGYEWADEEAPRFQLAPMGYRGYIDICKLIYENIAPGCFYLDQSIALQM